VSAARPLQTSRLPKRHEEMVAEITGVLIEKTGIGALPFPALKITFKASQRFGHIPDPPE